MVMKSESIKELEKYCLNKIIHNDIIFSDVKKYVIINKTVPFFIGCSLIFYNNINRSIIFMIIGLLIGISIYLSIYTNRHAKKKIKEIHNKDISGLVIVSSEYRKIKRESFEKHLKDNGLYREEILTEIIVYLENRIKRENYNVISIAIYSTSLFAIFFQVANWTLVRCKTIEEVAKIAVMLCLIVISLIALIKGIEIIINDIATYTIYKEKTIRNRLIVELENIRIEEKLKKLKKEEENNENS